MNRFYEIPVEDLQQIDPEWETRRKNADESKALIHVETLDALVAEKNSGVMTMSLDEYPEQIVPYPVYQGEELTELLNSSDWNPEGGTV